MFTIKNIFIGFGLILVDVGVYIFFGLFLMGYDDFYDESKGPYWSLESMTNTEKITYIGLNVWHVINFVAIGIVIYRIIKLVKSGRWQQRTM